MKKVFLGGTCNNSLWRDELIPKITIDYYNPIVPNWTEALKQKEIQERLSADYCLYVYSKKPQSSRGDGRKKRRNLV